MTDKGHHHAINAATPGNAHRCITYCTQLDLGLIFNTGTPITSGKLFAEQQLHYIVNL